MAGYAYPDVLVETQWVSDHLDDPNVCLIEAGLLVAYLITRNFLTSWILTLVVILLLAFLLDFSIALVLLLAVSADIVLYAHRDNIKKEWSQNRHRG